MRQITLEEAGVDMNRLVRFLGEEKVIQALGEERTLIDLVRLLGKDRVRELLERIPDKPDGNGHDPAGVAAG